ncbi:MAG TPA: protein translocase subunit SecF [Caldisericia bacterium]|jgi:preprotein translocase subunit SecF|nr:MAG: preprotein translocase subunit SecF [bacterium ADurb.Bin132]HNY60912.1 protein translocase subunit SecF [Caldisericia bacterium]HOC79865.1 protein translocase subunit SecF [Caldisericia bacterium]HOG69631.1 protein translocase subunit SecF [Caldisericia bacterium]HPA65723.1 protein translocase subunit SecF [Caldisericia bacterium]
MKFLNPTHWDIIGKLKWLIVSFIAVICFGVLVIGFRWVTTGSKIDTAYFIFEKAIPGQVTEIAKTVYQFEEIQKLSNFSIEVPAPDANYKEQVRLNIKADKLTNDEVKKIGERLSTEYGKLAKDPAIETTSLSGQPFNWGLDFTGGTILEMTFKNPFVDNTGKAMADEEVIGKVRTAFAKNGVSLTVVQVQRLAMEAEQGKDIANSILIRTQESSDTKLKSVITDLISTFGEEDVANRKIDTIGPVVGQELKRSAVLALVIALAVIFIYIAFRFQPRAGVAAIACLIHDLALTLGVLSLAWVEINSAAVAALLALISYDVQDTVVVMDRVRENTKLYLGKMPYDKLINMSITQTFMRSFNTSFTTMIGILVILFLGGKTILDFSLIFLFGLTAGTWSSIYIAAPLLVVWKNFENRVSTNQPRKTYQLSTPEGIKVAVKETQPQINKPAIKDNLAGKPPAKKGPPKKKSNKRR